MKNIGIILVVVGIIMTLVTGFNFVTREKVVDVGPVHVSKNKDNPVHWSPVIGGVVLVAGIVIMVSNKGRK